MTIKVAGHWEIGYHAPVTEAYYWNFVLREFQVKDWLMAPVSGIYNNEERAVTLTEFPDYDSMLESTGELTRVFLEPRTNHQNPDTIWLHEFEHPENAFYIFGPEDGTLGKKILSRCPYKTYIPTKGCMNLAASVNVILYDRLAKRLSKNFPFKKISKCIIK